jgi:predicted nucleic acid-binding protein
MIRLFLDTNVFFDVFQVERSSHHDANALAKYAARHQVELVLSSISVMNALYSLRKAGHDMKSVLQLMSRLLPILVIAPVDGPDLLAGINSGWTDLEDAIQFHAAITAGRIDAIVSNDKDFKQQDMIPVITPALAVRRLK